MKYGVLSEVTSYWLIGGRLMKLGGRMCRGLVGYAHKTCGLVAQRQL
jgi:hypothetical protein